MGTVVCEPRKLVTMETMDKDNGTREFVGYVTEMGGGRFTAILRDESDPDRKYVATFDVDKDVPEEDVPLVELGAVFHLLVYDGNQKELVLRFNRPSSLSKEDIDRINDNAERLNRTMNWD